MSEEIKNIQTNNQTENGDINNQNSYNQDFQKIMNEIEIIKEKILNINFESKSPFEKPEEKKEEKKEFKLG